MNGVCVKWVGWVDLETLNGKARLVYDEDQAKVRSERLHLSAADRVTAVGL